MVDRFDPRGIEIDRADLETRVGDDARGRQTHITKPDHPDPGAAILYH